MSSDQRYDREYLITDAHDLYEPFELQAARDQSASDEPTRFHAVRWGDIISVVVLVVGFVGFAAVMGMALGLIMVGVGR